ncbi:hypothetical protein [Actinocorallia longicatena]|uniref:Lipoprotein n=1 Tax=Actinocorallia longicatena TaxID=111803 RepID=A0ABP6QLR5_9ACTN
MRAPVIAALLLPAALTAALTAACGRAEDAAAPAAPALTKEQARTVLTSYAATNARADKALDPALLATVETGPQLDMDVAAYKLHAASRTKLRPYAFTAPRFYIPRLSGHPRWFAVDTESAAKGAKIRHALLFVQDEAGGTWKLAADPQRRDGGPIDGIELDAEGYARPATGEGLSVAPASLGEAHAVLLDSGPKAPGAAGIAAGSQTTQTYDVLQQVKSQLAKARLTFGTRFSAVPGQTYALRTADGGAVVWYVLQQQESYAGKGIPVAGDLIGLVPEGKATSLTSTTLIQYLAAIPARGDASITGATRKAVAAETTP